jgi:protein-tyrosine phosphatase
MDNTDISEIIPHLYLSNWETSNNPNILKKYNIKAVITVETRPKPQNIVNYYRANNIDHMFIRLPDVPDANISEYFEPSFQFISKHIMNGENVLVHCWAGISRSTTLVVNYLIKNSYDRDQVSTCPCKLLQNIINYVRSKRHFINPNTGFQKQLLQEAIEYERERQERKREIVEYAKYKNIR